MAKLEQKSAAIEGLHTQCPFCSVQCKMTVKISSREPGETKERYFVEGAENEASQGRVCVKGLNAHQHSFHSQRLTSPLIRIQGDLVPCSWERAIGEMERRFNESAARLGRDGNAVYGGGSLTNETAYLLGKFARVALGTRYIDYNGRFCMSAAASAGTRTFGMDRGLTFRLSDIPKAQCIILAGTNIAECQPTLLPYFNQAKDNGAKIIVIDPRKTATAAIADIHLPVKPGNDALLGDAILKIMVGEGLVDEKFILSRTKGYEELKDYLNGISLDEAAETCGVELQKIRDAALCFGAAETGMVLTARGVEQQADGHLAVRHFLNLLLASGKIGREGCGYGAITGQGNGQGGREHGQKADQLPGYRSIENEEDRAYVAKVWGIEPGSLPGKGVSAYEMMELIGSGDISSLFVMGSNPVVSNPNAGFVEKALQKLDFLVVADMFLSETAKMADLVLPVTSYIENGGTLTNLEGRVLLREAQVSPPGDARHDWEILCAVAIRMGKGSFFQYSDVEDIFNELRVASRYGAADYYGITYERLRQEGGLYWPCPSLDKPGEGLLFQDSFPLPDGRAAFTTETGEVWKGESREYPLTLTNGRVLAHYLTGVQTRRSPSLLAREIENFMEIHPETARKYGVRDGEWVEITSKEGLFTVRSRYKEGIREDTVFVPMHWGGAQNLNRATRPDLDPYCRMPAFKTAAVSVRPLRS
ncbi:assimilatory nitrate reductase catalytic subunit NasC [Paenibacillus lemnae]|uniref:Molybdopterin oxidoreductase family protein n=1 Tax=Paenibacillus lemnae TaxID=1330551 RepID=A0A848M5H1_PAELE|nr:molybdopterin oxidoreductase family protein [Paenibacillus lemnae]NMO95846.1 molybdopterin oxidoreductase family protein [Paenibacillus lemnae]